MPELPHSFRDAALLELALTHSSTGNPANNERLEFLGDAALDLVIAEELFRREEHRPEGELTEMKAHVVSRHTLAGAARELGLEEMARVGGGLTRRTLSRSVLANLYEAVLGAVYVDGGLEATRAFVLETLAHQLAAVQKDEKGKNPKQLFQEHCQREWGEPPEYEVLEARGQAHARAFLVRARSGERTFPSAWGRTHKEAERWAAYEALLVLEEDERGEG